MEWTAEQLHELTRAAHTHPKPGPRVKALAVLAVARGKRYQAVGEMLDTNYHSISAWVHGYRERGLQAFEIAPGRGRPKRADDEELKTYALQSPRNFGIKRSRWTLDLLGNTVPSLKGFSASGVHQALRRCGISYKRGQPWMLSPDPEYEKKVLVITAALEHARRYPQSVVAVFQDEASFYRQPSQGWLWGWAGRKQPRMPWSHRSNTLVRAAGCLNAMTGDTHVLQAKHITVPRLIESYRQLLEAYPKALMIYLIQDNWPVHSHEKVRAFRAQHPRLQVLYLPTYAPRLNAVEKLWRWVRQTLCHAHPFCDDFSEFKAQLRACFEQAAAGPADMLRYCGLTDSKIFCA
jgi:transposase